MVADGSGDGIEPRRKAERAPSVGDWLEVAIDDLDNQGRGVARHQGVVVFVAGGVPGDLLRVRVTHQGRRHLGAQLLAVVSPSPDRRRPPCILADHCGGCSLQPLTDPAQQRWKHRAVEQALRRIGGLEVPVRPLLAAAGGLGYRNRAVIPLERGDDGALRAGYYRRGSHRIVNMSRCPVLDPRIDEMVAPLKADLESTDWPMDHHGRRGGLRHLALRVGARTGERLLTLIAADERLPGLEDWAATWRARWPDLVGVCLNLQPEPTNLLMGPRTRRIDGRDWLQERFAGLTLRIGADAFFQVHTLQAERVVPLLLEALGPTAGSLLDAYCGSGTFSLPLAAAGWRVHGIEQQSGAVDQARANATENGLQDRASFERAEVAAVLADRLEGVEALFVDPPRKGLEAAVIEAIASRPPRTLLYLSCDPATLARDLGRLTAEVGYRLASVQPIDFFPNTTHVETLAVLEKA